MENRISRFDFLRGNFAGSDRSLRPPWAIEEDRFTDVCDQCGDCIKACPEQIIVRGRGGYPLIEFSNGECTFCGACAESCSSGALVDGGDNRPWDLVARLDAGKCLAYRAIECRSCFDPCATRAIELRHQLGAVSVPVIDADRCTGCGACFGACPTSAIEMRSSLEVAA